MAPKTKKISGTLASSDLNVKIAWLYHVEGMTQEAIASLLGMNRIKVMRSLAQSATENVIVTTINASSAEQIRLERALEARWNLESAIVVPSPANLENLERSIGHAVGNYLNTQMTDGMTLAVGGGATLHASLDFMHRRELSDASVVGLVGCLPHSQWINPSIVASEMAMRLGVDSYQITAPVVVDDADLRRRLWAQPLLDDVRQRAMRADMAVLTVGEIAPTATVFNYGIVPQQIADALRRSGAVANLLCFFLDEQGRLVEHEINERVIALAPDDLAAIPRIILAAGGLHKVEAIRAALKAVRTRILITDFDTAVALLATDCT